LPIAALARGASELTGALFSDDTRYMAEALNQLGIRVEANESATAFSMTGGAAPFRRRLPICSSVIPAPRFVSWTAVLTLGHGVFRIDGIPRMRQRPIQPPHHRPERSGRECRQRRRHRLPARPRHRQWFARRDGDRPRRPEQASIFSAFADRGAVCPRRHGDPVEGDLVSKPYMPMTASVMRAFGVDVELDQTGWQRFAVAPGQRYIGACLSHRTRRFQRQLFFAAPRRSPAVACGSMVRLQLHQGDLPFVRVLEAMGARVTIADDYT